MEPGVQVAAGLQLQPLLDDVIEDVDEGVLAQPVVHLVQLEVERRETLRDLGDEWMRALLVLLVGGDEVVVQPGLGHGYGF